MQPNNNTFFQPPTNQPGQQNNTPLQNYSPMTPKHSPPIFLIISLVIVAILLVIACIMAFMFYAKAADYKNNTDQKISAAVDQSNKSLTSELQSKFDEQQKSPNKTYTSPAEDGSISFSYPKTWSAYILEQNNGNTALDGYFQSNFVQSTANNKNNFDLRMMVSTQSYNNVLNQYQSNIKNGSLKSSPYVDANVKNATPGVRLDGQLNTNKQGSMVIVPIRDKVLQLWTENSSSTNDFNNVVLKTLTYSP